MGRVIGLGIFGLTLFCINLIPLVLTAYIIKICKHIDNIHETKEA